MLFAVIGILIIIIIVLTVKILSMQKAADETATAFNEKLTTDTNTLITISSRDKYMRSLAESINAQLKILNAQRHRFQQGDTELKNAVTNISHDLRTPLTAIYGYLDLIEQEEKSESAERYISIIRNRTEILKQLTDELFGYSVIISTREELKSEPIEINCVLEESIAAFYSALNEKEIVPSIKIPENKVIRTLDKSALSRVFANLLTNAVKYSDGDLDIVLNENGTITFMNTASKLNEVQVGKLFDRFYTVEAARKSTGLGLSIARTLVEQMNGTISAEYKNSLLVITITFAS